MREPRPADTVSLELVRTGLVTGVLALGAVAFFVHQNAQPAGERELVWLRNGVYALTVAAIAAAVVMRPLISRARTHARAATLTVVTWALAETPAVAGAAHYLMTGSAAMFAAGTLVFVAVLLVTGIPESVAG